MDAEKANSLFFLGSKRLWSKEEKHSVILHYPPEESRICEYLSLSLVDEKTSTLLQLQPPQHSSKCCIRTSVSCTGFPTHRPSINKHTREGTSHILIWLAFFSFFSTLRKLSVKRERERVSESWDELGRHVRGFQMSTAGLSDMIQYMTQGCGRLRFEMTIHINGYPCWIATESLFI